jgi:hypothetical protein
VTTIEAQYYSPEDYAKFTPTKKQKHFQLMRAMKATRNSGKTNNSSAAELTTAIIAVSAAALAISELTAATTKHAAAECGETNDSDAIVEPKWGRNHNNPAAAGRQEHILRSQRPDWSEALCLHSVQPNFLLTLSGTLLTLALK